MPPSLCPKSTPACRAGRGTPRRRSAWTVSRSARCRGACAAGRRWCGAPRTPPCHHGAARLEQRRHGGHLRPPCPVLGVDHSSSPAVLFTMH
ncbi:Os06g0135300 [Oryza sativa Japonica Group]|uniref:Os06g0135300 protein n=2 Tax=Oryza sativa subsp. japonica TaxID=39947 RepID=C7J390_ORYSJ|nr:hypothetical protein EE612_031780 [Oryza sativa]BAH93316.1 Os06g0135340 [Oryza sativa Japonica Group]BAS96025.1 Os06g0135300 [Oryza sativa Japonica Group]|eukprot:NP_001174588.1 Os06g0135340 [Oryza sativa Japonica Group]